MSDFLETTTFGALIKDGALEIGDGYRAKLEELGGDGPIFLRAGAMTNRGFDWASSERFHQTISTKLGTKLGRPGDTVVTTKGNSVGRTSYIGSDAPEFVYSPHLSYWRSLDRDRLVSEFLRYWSQSPEFSEQLRAMAHGTDMAPYLSLVDQQRLKISLPSVTVQIAITSLLGALDDKIAANGQIAKSALLLGAAVFSDLTLNAKVGRLSGLTSPILGGTPDRAIERYWVSEVPWASAKDVVACNFDLLLVTQESISTQASIETRARRVPSGSTILTARGTVGAVARTGCEMAFNQSCYAFTPSKRLPESVLYFTIKLAASLLQGKTHGTVFETVTMQTFNHVDVPALDESEAMAVEARLAPLLRTLDGHLTENQVLSNLRDTLLPKLISGEVRIKDAERLVSDAV